ncbi:spermatogenesis- and oogenesis-specific basic helix-loop-helix-containing protein 1 [Tachyglossus aculeatus]|uniref:spermatogenesis- and oogenesis-specific basic helix-loop-helix-containing protein 1 n=1 Tax=Tachyglossus aculeatus TaxID=9261 RepID=UPI0018F62EF8|nr:spermatogenesis- and oogenesis-specific basic helix-loop-helix-containing protein 1 [Tachyglossus aculeatus]
MASSGPPPSNRTVGSFRGTPSSPRSGASGRFPSNSNFDPEDITQENGLPEATMRVSKSKQNVVLERHRRKRISSSCEQLRTLLPRFDGRREDMASILEMTVKFLELTHTLVPLEQQTTILAPSAEMYSKWQKNTLAQNTRKRIPEDLKDTKTRDGRMAGEREPLVSVSTAVENSMLGSGADICLETMEDAAVSDRDRRISDISEHGGIYHAPLEQSRSWSSFMQQPSPLLSSTLPRWWHQPECVFTSFEEDCLPASILESENKPSGMLMSPILNNRLLSEYEIEKEMPFMPWADSFEWLGEQDLETMVSTGRDPQTISTATQLKLEANHQEIFLQKVDPESQPTLYPLVSDCLGPSPGQTPHDYQKEVNDIFFDLPLYEF